MLKLLLPILLLLSLNLTAQMGPYKWYEPRDFKKLPYVDPELRVHVLSFIIEMQSNGLDLNRLERIDSIIIVPDETIICGNIMNIGCAYSSTVKIKRWSYYYQDSFTYFKQMIYHELGHAVLRLPHFNGRFAIMNSRIDNQMSAYKVNWSMLVYEMLQFYYFCRYNSMLIGSY